MQLGRWRVPSWADRDPPSQSGVLPSRLMPRSVAGCQGLTYECSRRERSTERITIAMLVITALELWALWTLGERDDRRRQSGPRSRLPGPTRAVVNGGDVDDMQIPPTRHRHATRVELRCLGSTGDQRRVTEMRDHSTLKAWPRRLRFRTAPSVVIVFRRIFPGHGPAPHAAT